MLTLKFFVPLTPRLLNVRTLAEVSCPREKTCKPQESFEDRRGVKGSRCLDYNRALQRCPRVSAKHCPKKKCHDQTPQPKCNWSSADDYRRAYGAIKCRSKKLEDLVSASSTLLIREMRGEIAKRRCDENSHIRRIIDSVKTLILELSKLDPVCAMKMKRQVLLLNDHAYNELANRDCATELGVRSIESEIDQLACRTKSLTDASLALVYSCRECRSPEGLLHCVEHGSREASKILDDLRDEFETRMTGIKKTKEETLNEDEKFFKEVTKEYERNMSQLSSEIGDCVREMKSNRRLT